jgi:hypothetical protein
VAIHGSGVVDADGRGTLFAGQSGAGKTTMARLWLSEPGVKILSDERVVLRQEGDVVWMYGTPWHGDGRISNPGRAPLDRICFLRHAARNQMTALAPTETIARLFSCCFPPFYDAAGLDDVLGSLERIAARCRSVELGFVPGAVEPRLENDRCARQISDGDAGENCVPKRSFSRGDSDVLKRDIESWRPLSSSRRVRVRRRRAAGRRDQRALPRRRSQHDADHRRR